MRYFYKLKICTWNVCILGNKKEKLLNKRRDITNECLLMRMLLLTTISEVEREVERRI